MKIETYGKVGLLAQAMRKIQQPKKGWGFVGLSNDPEWDTHEEEN